MRLTTKLEAGSIVAMTFGPRGAPKISGSGTARAVVTGDVVDKDGNRLGDFFDIGQIAVEAWEMLLGAFGVTVTKESGT
jgi:hypothetical protein